MSQRYIVSARVTLWMLTLSIFGLLAIQPAIVSHAAAIDGDIWWDDVYHDSRDPLYRSPGGPVEVNSQITIRIRTAANDVSSVTLRVWNDRLNAQNLLQMTKVHTDGTSDLWAHNVHVGSVPNVLYYRFILHDSGGGTATAYYEDDSRKWGGVGQMFGSSPDNSFGITVYDPAFQTPDWVKNAVFYQVFVDRFADGNLANNTPEGSFFYNEAGGTIERSNSDAWNTPVCDPRATSGTACDGSYSRNFYGGDLQGLIDKLDYLEDLGVTALYLNPIFESPSNHKYDTSDFSVIDDNFGTLADFHTLVAEADSRGMKVVLDGVFNHVSAQGPYLDRYHQYSDDTYPLGACEDTASPYEPMIQFIPFVAGPNHPSPWCSDNRDYNSWWGYDSLALIDSSSAMARDMVFGDGITHPLGGAMPAIASYWISQGAAGWRLDVAPDIDAGIFHSPGNDYWENFRAEVHSADPDAYIIGEEWGYATDWTTGGAEGSVTFPTGNPGEWDGTMNYQQSAALLSFWRDTVLNAENDFNGGSSAGPLEPYSPSMFVERYLNLMERYSPEAFAAMLNLLGSHDTQRALWLLDHGHPSEPANGDLHPSGPGYDWSDALNRLRGVALMQFTLPGAPQIYYGDEVGLVGQSRYDGSQWQDDPYNRQPYPWLDQAGTPLFSHLQSESAQQVNFDYFALLADTRADHPALRTGSVDFVLVDDANQKLAYLRQTSDDADSAVVLVNRGDSAQSFTIDLAGKVAEGMTFDDALTPAVEAYSVSGGMLHVPDVAADSGALLIQTGAAALRPAVPANLSATASTNEIMLTWDAASGADSYNVYRSHLSGAGYALLGTTTDTSYSDTDVEISDQFFYVVEAVNSTSLLKSGYSNEAVGTMSIDLTGAWSSVQWPATLVHVASTENATEAVYGQIWVSGYTDQQNSPVAGLSAQVGWGPLGSVPTGADWEWFDMEPNTGFDFGGNNDEFMGSLLPDQIGDFSYTVRYSGDDGANWLYAAGEPGGGGCDISSQPGYVLCTMTVNQSSDITPPTAPTVVKEHDTTSSIGISWSGATDENGVAFYRVYRSANGGSAEQIAELGADVSSYVDNDVTSGDSYAYTVTAVDTSFNESTPSNTVNATAENSLVDVTFTVTTPSFTPADSTVQVIGDAIELTAWGAGVDLAPTTNPHEYAVTLQVPENTSLEYKFRRDGMWEKVEKAADGIAEVPNRSYTVGLAEDGPYTASSTVINWRDVLVTGTSPADDATDVTTADNIVVTFNKAVDIDTEFEVLDSDNEPVAGTFSVDNSGTPTVTFDPSSNLTTADTYTVNVSGVAASGDQQYHSYTFDFSTLYIELLVNGDFEADPANKKLAPWKVVKRTKDKMACNPVPRAKPTVSGYCAFKFVGSANENSKLTQEVLDNGVLLAAGDEISFSAQFSAGAKIKKFRMILEVRYSDAPRQKLKLLVPPTSGYVKFSLPALTIASDNLTSVKVTFNNRSQKGRVFVDDASLTLGQGDARGGFNQRQPLPPPNVPSGWRVN